MSKEEDGKVLEFKNKLKEKGLDVSEFENIINEIKGGTEDRKYGLVWEDNVEEVEEELKYKTPILKEEESLRIYKGEEYTDNLLIEGDNLESLTYLKNEGRKVDLIYLDPPYNTMSSEGGLTYKDSRVNRGDKYKHSSWLSFMEKRLKIARDLMTEDGIMFISIDDRELYNLKLLCDIIFGETNFISNIVWEKGSGSNSGRFFRKNKEYVLVYSRDRERLVSGGKKLRALKKGYNAVSDLVEEGIKKGKTEEEVEKDLREHYRKNKNLKGIKRYFKVEEGTYKVYGDIPLHSPMRGTYYHDIIHPDTNKPVKKPSRGWRGTKEFMEKLIEDDQIIFGKDHTTIPRRKVYLERMKYELPVEVIKNPSQGGSEFRDILGDVDAFTYPKPVSLMQELFYILPHDRDFTILDFFSGSGTTGQAVLEYNKEHGTNHNFILCTNNENNICREVTYQRLNKVINGYTTLKGKGVEGIPSNLKYYKTELIDRNKNKE